MKNWKLILLLLGTLPFSCSEDDNSRISLADTASETCTNTKVFDSNFTGTACCSQRNSELTIGNTIEYQYFTNLDDPNITWEVKSRDIEIISGGNSNIVTIRLSDSFTEGELYVLGTGTSGQDAGLVCGHTIAITNKSGHKSNF